MGRIHLRISAIWLGTCAAAAATLVGCAHPYDALDAEASRIIHRQQARTLGPDAATDPRVKPELGANPRRSGEAKFRFNPRTHNPPAEELAAYRAGTQEVNQVPAPLDNPDKALRLDLAGLLGYAITHSPDYRNQKEELFLSTLNLIMERHLWGPRFFDSVTGQVSGTPESGDHDQALELINELSVTQRLPYGGDVSATVLADYTHLLQQGAANDTLIPGGLDEQDASVAFSANLPLLRDAGRATPRREQRIQTERNLVYAVRSFERFRRQFLVDTSNTYFDLLRQQRQIANQRTQLKNLQSLAHRFDALARAGFEPQFQAEQAQQQVLFGRNTLTNAEKSYAAALDAFKLRIGMPTTRDLVVVPAEVKVPEPALRENKAVTRALRNRLDLQTAQDKVNDGRRGVLVAKNQTLADLDLFARLNVPTTPLRRVAGLSFDPGVGNYSAGATLDLPLDRKNERARVRIAQVRSERAYRDYQTSRDRVALEVRRSIRRIRQARFTLRLQNRNVTLAKRRAEGVRLRERTLGPRDVIDAQEDLLNARNSRDGAVADLRQNILQFLLNTGQMRVSPTGRWLPPGKLVHPAGPKSSSSEAPPKAQGPGKQTPARPPGQQSPAPSGSKSNTLPPPPVPPTLGGSSEDQGQPLAPPPPPPSENGSPSPGSQTRGRNQKKASPDMQ